MNKLTIRLHLLINLTLFILLVFAAGFSLRAQAEEISGGEQDINKLFLHLNGYAVHFNGNEDENNFLIGTGFTYNWRHFQKFDILASIEVDVFKDSNEKISALAGISFVKNLGLASVGLNAHIMYKDSFIDDAGTPILPLVLPFVELGQGSIRLRMFYIPPIRTANDHQVDFQLLIGLD